jgi:N-acetylmuramic acid 6-phosphate etherase
MKSAVLLGIDTGGSHTTVAVARDDLKVLARADGPGAAMRPGAAESSAVVIAETARRAAAQAGVRLPADRVVVGAAGAGREAEQQELEAALIAHEVGMRVRVVGDGQIALAAAFRGEPGIFLNAGTGSVAFARDPQGRLHRSGGYGWQLGDEGGGYWLGRRALAAAARATDGRGEGSTLTARLLGALGLKDFDDLVRWTSTATPAQVASLAPHLLNAAREGETVAQQTVDEAAGELAALVRILLRHFPAEGPVRLATGGGLLRPDTPLARALYTTLGAELPRVHIRPEPVDPPLGALFFASELE